MLSVNPESYQVWMKHWFPRSLVCHFGFFFSLLLYTEKSQFMEPTPLSFPNPICIMWDLRIRVAMTTHSLFSDVFLWPTSEENKRPTWLFMGWQNPYIPRVFHSQEGSKTWFWVAPQDRWPVPKHAKASGSAPTYGIRLHCPFQI